MTDDILREKVCKRARKKLEENCHLDVAPGKNYISFRKNDVNYYAPNLIYTAETLNYKYNNGYFPLLVKDALKTKDPRQLYHNEGANAANKHVSFFSNHPLLKISITGKITFEKTIETARKNEQGNTVNECLHILEIDDGSSSTSIKVRVNHIQYAFNQMSYNSNRNTLFRIDGHIAFYYLKQTMDLNREVRADNVTPVCNRSDFQREINWWKTAVDARRKYLQKPWVIRFGPYENELSNSEGKNQDLTVCEDIVTLPAETTSHESENGIPESVISDSILRLQNAFLKFMIKKHKHKTLKMDDMCADATMRAEIQGVLDNLSLHPDNIELREIYGLVIKKFSDIRMVKQKSTTEVSILKFSRLFCYIKNMMKFLTTSQEVEVYKLIKKFSYSNMNRHTYKDIQKYLKQIIHFSIDLRKLAKELTEKFNIKSVPLELINTMIEESIGGDYITKGGIRVREFQGTSNFKIVLKWISLPGEPIWKYVPKLYLD